MSDLTNLDQNMTQSYDLLADVTGERAKPASGDTFEKRFKDTQAELTKAKQALSQKEKEFQERLSHAEPWLKFQEELQLRNVTPEAIQDLKNRIAFHNDLAALAVKDPGAAISKFVQIVNNLQTGNAGQNGSTGNAGWSGNGGGGNRNAGWSGSGNNGQYVDQEARNLALQTQAMLGKMNTDHEIARLQSDWKTKFGVDVAPDEIWEELEETGVKWPTPKQVHAAAMSRYQENIIEAIGRQKQAQVSDQIKQGNNAQVFGAASNANGLENIQAQNESPNEKKPATYNEGLEMALSNIKKNASSG